jgi:NAD(P)H-nitrite reductase large subunit
MILENIEGFTRGPFVMDIQDSEFGTREQMMDTARKALERSVQYYLEAAIKLKGQAEVARTLKTIAKKYKRQLDNFPG